MPLSVFGIAYQSFCCFLVLTDVNILCKFNIFILIWKTFLCFIVYTMLFGLVLY